VPGSVEDQVAGYRALLAQGDSILLVTHAQSAYYANLAYDRLGTGQAGNLGDLVRVIAVATPAEYVAGSGAYTNLATDAFVQLYQAWDPRSLPPNVSGGNWGNWNHDFVGGYLGVPQARRKILSDIVQAIQALHPNDGSPTKSE
jgi:hypothetical protein